VLSADASNRCFPYSFPGMYANWINHRTGSYPRRSRWDHVRQLITGRSQDVLSELLFEEVAFGNMISGSWKVS
jgi:hypothetical protein